MARKSRMNYIPGKCYHIYNRGNRKMKVFNLPSDRNFFIEKLRFFARECNIEVISYCLMDNHFHQVLRQGYTDMISKYMQRSMTSYCMYFNSRYSLVGHTFQGRYKSRLISGSKDLGDTLDYVLNNPVKAGYVDNPFHYAWSCINPGYEKYLSLCEKFGKLQT